MPTRGTLVLVVGPSGAGKDSLIEGARARLSTDDGFVFPQRDITRAADLGGEDYNAVSTTEFDQRQAAGAYSLSWGAHNLFYGVPISIEQNLQAGSSVVVNVSRVILDDARHRLPPVRVVNVTVPEAVLAERLAARGRESLADIEARLARATAYDVVGDDVVHFINDRPLTESIAAFVEVLASCQPVKGWRPSMPKGRSRSG